MKYINGRVYGNGEIAAAQEECLYWLEQSWGEGYNPAWAACKRYRSRLRRAVSRINSDI